MTDGQARSTDPAPSRAQAEFSPETTHLDTAALGLPPRRTVAAVQAALATWQAGRAHAPGYDDAVRSARAAYAHLVGVRPGDVAIGSTVSAFAGKSADGRLADLDALTAATAATGTRVLLDTTQAVGWLPVDAGRFAYTTGGGYQCLLAPRGTCSATIRADALVSVVPHSAGW